MNLAAKMTLDGAGFAGPLAGIQNQLGGAIGQLAALAGVTLTVGGAILGLKNAMNLGGELSDLETRTGIAVDDLALLRQAFDDAGVGADNAAPSINQMQRVLGTLNAAGELTTPILKQLGINLDELKKKSPIEQVDFLGKRIMSIEDPAKRAAAAMQIFGDSGAKLLTLFADSGALDNAALVLGKQAEVLARNAQQFDRASDILGNAPVKLRGFFVGAAESITASLLEPLEKFNAADLTSFGQKVGKAIAPIIELVKDGRLGELLGASVEAGFAVIAQDSFWTGIAKIALAAFEGIGGNLIRIFTSPITYLQAGMDYAFQAIAFKLSTGPLGKLFGFGAGTVLPPSFEQLLKERREGGTLLGDFGQKALDNSAARMKDGAADLKEAFKTGLDLSDRLKKIWQDGQDAADKSLAAAQNLSTSINASGDDAERRAGAGKLAQTTGDRLERIGGFIGGPGGPERDYARRTAENTGKLVEGIKQLANRISGPSAAVWGDGSAFA